MRKYYLEQFSSGFLTIGSIKQTAFNAGVFAVYSPCKLKYVPSESDIERYFEGTLDQSDHFCTGLAPFDFKSGVGWSGGAKNHKEHIPSPHHGSANV